MLKNYFGLRDPIRQPEKSASDHFFKSSSKVRALASQSRREGLTPTQNLRADEPILVRIPSLTTLGRAIRRAERRDHLPIYRVFVIDLVG